MLSHLCCRQFAIRAHPVDEAARCHMIGVYEWSDKDKVADGCCNIFKNWLIKLRPTNSLCISLLHFDTILHVVGSWVTPCPPLSPSLSGPSRPSCLFMIRFRNLWIRRCQRKEGCVCLLLLGFKKRLRRLCSRCLTSGWLVRTVRVFWTRYNLVPYGQCIALDSITIFEQWLLMSLASARNTGATRPGNTRNIWKKDKKGASESSSTRR